MLPTTRRRDPGGPIIRIAELRRRRGGTRAALLGVLAPVMVVSACTGGGHPAPGAVSTPVSPTTSGHCTLSAKLVPSCGALWGISTTPATVAQQQLVARMVGRGFDIVYRYHDIDDVVPTPTERQLISQGHILHIDIASRQYAIPAGKTAANAPPVNYANVSAGDFDVGLRRQAQGVAGLHVPVFVTFEQEANQRAKLGPRGTAAQFVAAWRHVHAVFAKAGASNAVWTWVMTGASDNLARAGQLWPGNAYVDWISWNVYNQSGCKSGHITESKYRSFNAAFMPFYTWVHTVGPKIGIDPSKPMMISEAGSVLYSADPHKTADWYAQIPTVIAKYPQVKAVQLWDSATSSSCNYEFQRNPEVLKGVTAAGHAMVFNGYNGHP